MWFSRPTGEILYRQAELLLELHMAIEVRRAEESEFSAVATLLNSYSLENLSADERESGFVQGSFKADKVAWFAQSLAVLVAVDQGAVVGALCACNLKDGVSSGPLSALIPRLDDWRLNGEAIDAGECLGYGPVCIDRKYRGQHLLKQLYQALMQLADGSLLYGVAFVDQENPKSLAAHVDGLGMSVLGNYRYDDRTLTAIGFRIRG
jgi:hypothetical protein